MNEQTPILLVPFPFAYSQNRSFIGRNGSLKKLLKESLIQNWVSGMETEAPGRSQPGLQLHNTAFCFVSVTLKGSVAEIIPTLVKMRVSEKLKRGSPTTDIWCPQNKLQRAQQFRSWETSQGTHALVLPLSHGWHVDTCQLPCPKAGLQIRILLFSLAHPMQNVTKPQFSCLEHSFN